MFYINKNTKIFDFLPLAQKDLLNLIVVSDLVAEDKAAILYYRNEYKRCFESPITLGGKSYEVFRGGMKRVPVLIRDGRIFHQIFPRIFLFYEKGDEDTPALAGVCKL